MKYIRDSYFFTVQELLCYGTCNSDYLYKKLILEGGKEIEGVEADYNGSRLLSLKTNAASNWYDDTIKLYHTASFFREIDNTVYSKKLFYIPPIFSRNPEYPFNLFDIVYESKYDG